MTKPLNQDENFSHAPIETKEQGITTKYVGTRKLRDVDTGELIELEYMEKQVSHSLKRGWRRVYMENFMEILVGCSASKKVEVIEFILENLNSENQFTQTQEYVIKELQMSSRTINETFKYLVKSNFMKKVGTAYVVNPRYVCAFGSDKKNATIAVKYSYNDEPTLPNL